jgi:cystathionine beta-lyase/cystathionine gamma-synthase
LQRKRKRSIDTLAAQAGVDADRAFGPVSVPIYQTAIYRPHPSTMTHADIPLEEQAAVGLTPRLVRLSVGIENPDDLVADLAQTLRKAKGSN